MLLFLHHKAESVATHHRLSAQANRLWDHSTCLSHTPPKWESAGGLKIHWTPFLDWVLCSLFNPVMSGYKLLLCEPTRSTLSWIFFRINVPPLACVWCTLIAVTLNPATQAGAPSVKIAHFVHVNSNHCCHSFFSHHKAAVWGLLCSLFTGRTSYPFSLASKWCSCIAAVQTLLFSTSSHLEAGWLRQLVHTGGPMCGKILRNLHITS